jgi:hypothetical protein
VNRLIPWVFTSHLEEVFPYKSLCLCMHVILYYSAASLLVDVFLHVHHRWGFNKCIVIAFVPTWSSSGTSKSWILTVLVDGPIVQFPMSHGAPKLIVSIHCFCPVSLLSSRCPFSSIFLIYNEVVKKTPERGISMKGENVRESMFVAIWPYRTVNYQSYMRHIIHIRRIKMSMAV